MAFEGARDTDGYVEIVGDENETAPLVLTCEHASNELPSPWTWAPSDRWLTETHWAYDLGARDLCCELTASLGAVAVLSRFSRLFADPNRPADASDLCRDIAEGRLVHLNATVDAEERERRLAAWHAYHDAVDRTVAASTAHVLFAVHTFTPEYEGAIREVEVGVLFDEETELADALHAAVAAAGFRVAMNEPYSGKNGLMYSVDRHARTHGRRPIEIELRQDLATSAHHRARLVSAIRHFASRVG